MISSKIAESQLAWQYLNGLINVYKPSGMSFFRLRSAIIHNLCRDLNGLEARPLKQRVEIEKVPHEDSYAVSMVPNLSDHPLATGPRYQMSDLKVIPAGHLGVRTSGVMLLGFDRVGVNMAFRIRQAMNTRVYLVTGKLGASTETNFTDSRIVERADYKHVYLEKLANLVSTVQSSYQRKAFDLNGVDMQSQRAFELASQGTVQPANSKVPVLLKIKLVEFKRPFFVLEIHSLNEDEAFLGRLVHELGLSLRTHAHCTQVRCISHGVFGVDSTLVREKWNLHDILSNMAFCNKVLKENSKMLRAQEIKIN